MKSTRRAVTRAVTLLLCLAACGDDEPSPGGPGPGQPDAGDGEEVCVETTVSEFPDEPFGAPDDLPIDGCVEGGLADVDLTGRWLISTDDPFNFEMPYISESCEDGVGVNLLGFGDEILHRDDTRLFIRARYEDQDFFYAAAYHVCAVDDSGSLAVVRGTCYNLDCSSAPAEMTRFERPPGEGEAEGLELVSEWSGGDEPWPAGLSLNLQVVNGLAFLARMGELRIIDVSDPAAPRDLGRHAAANEFSFNDFNDVKVFEADGGLYAVLAGDTTPVIDARDPENPVVAADIGEYSHSVFVRVQNGRPLAYLATMGNDVPIYDLSDPANPVLVQRVALFPQAGVHDLYAERNRLYVNGTTAGFLMLSRPPESNWSIDAVMPADFSHASWVTEVAGRKVAIHGDEGLGAHMMVVDVDPTSDEFMEPIGSYQTRAEVSIHNMVMVGSRAYVAYYQDGVRVLDLSDPTAPALAAYHHTWDLETGSSFAFSGAIGIVVDPDSGLIYVADTERGLLVFRETGR